MSTNKEYGPRGDPARHLPLAELRVRLAALPPASTDTGRVALIVARRADGVRHTPSSAWLTREAGVPGDRWQLTEDNPATQLTVMRRDVAEVLANGQPITHAGDNLFVDLDLSSANLPAGSRLRVGGAVVEVSPVPHNGCVKFRGRFGDGALRLVSAPELRGANLRGVYWSVVEAGEVACGDPIEVLSRAALPTAGWSRHSSGDCR